MDPLKVKIDSTYGVRSISSQCKHGSFEEQTMIFVFEVLVRPGYQAEAYARAWVRASELIQQAPGARGTRLHRKIGDPDRLLAIARWESKAARDEMERHRPDEVRRLIRQQAEFVDVRVIGEFEEPDWIVTPD